MRQRHGDAPKKKAGKKRSTAKKAAGKSPKKKSVKKKTAKKAAKKSPKSVKVVEPKGMFTQERVDIILTCMRDHYLFQFEAAARAKVTRRTVANWLQKGRRRRDQIEAWCNRYDDRDDNEETEADIVDDLGPCPESNQWTEFLDAYEDAETLAKMDMMKVVTRSAISQPDDAKWWLERRYPLDFGRASMRPGIGTNAGDTRDSRDTSAGCEVAELESAIAAFHERARSSTDPKAPRPANVQKA